MPAKITLRNVVRVKYLHDINSWGTSDQWEFLRTLRTQTERIRSSPSLPDNGLRAGYL